MVVAIFNLNFHAKVLREIHEVEVSNNYFLSFLNRSSNPVVESLLVKKRKG
jgi:hypothetical protein